MFIAYVESVQTGIAYPAVNDGQFFSGLFPLAPITEQYHIVAKVDELMALCDQLEAERNTREATHQQLIRAVHHPLTEAADTASTQTAWHRIRRNFSNLYTTLESVQALRQTILQLAVQGKLLPQDPSDEPASELLKRIQAEKARLVAEGKIKNQNPLPEISEDEKPFELPEGWEWVRLGTLGSCSTGKTPSTRNPEYYGEDIPFIGPGQITTDGDITSPEKFLSILGKSETTVADANDILMVCIGGSIGKCGRAQN